MNSMAVEPEAYFSSQSTSTSSTTEAAAAAAGSSATMDIDSAPTDKAVRSLPSLKDGLPETPAAFTWGPGTHTHTHHLHTHHTHEVSSYITTPSVFATPFTREPAGDYFGNATAADAAGLDSKDNEVDVFFTAPQTPSHALSNQSSTTASLPPSVLQRFQAAAHHSPGIVLPSMTPAAVNIESFAASSPSYFPSTDPDPSSLRAAPSSSSSNSNTAVHVSGPPSSSFSSSIPTHPLSALPTTSSFQLPPTPFMPPAPNARGGGQDLSWVPYPPNTRSSGSNTSTNPLPNRRSTSHFSLSAPLNMPSVASLQMSLSSLPMPPKPPVHRHSTIDLPPATDLEPVDPSLVAQWLKIAAATTAATDTNGGGTQQRNVLLLDMRSSVNFATSTIREAINISVPNMLLKRPMFTLAMVMNQLTSDRELALFADWKLYANLVFFDASGTAPSVGSPTFCMVQKFQREGCSAKLWYLQGGYNAFAPKHPDLLQSGSDSAESSSSKGPPAEAAAAATLSSSLPSTSASNSAPSITIPSSQSAMTPPRQRLHLGSLPTMMTTPMAGPLGCQTPMIENPNVNPLFESVRQAMGLNTAITEEIPIRMPKGFSVDIIRQHLPSWLLTAIDEEQGKTRLAEGFQRVEVNEQKRLALLMLPQAMRAGRTTGYSIGAGIEKGLKNRYNNVWPYDHSRVRIGECAANADDYINASFVNPPFGKKSYIATQGPLPQTFLDFWKVAWEQDARVVVMLTRELEMGRIKCHNYWPTKEEPLMDLEGMIQVCFVSESIPDVNSPTVLVRHLILRHCGPNGGERAIAQIQYSGWPDFGVPQTPIDVLRVVDLANHFNEEQPTRPMIVHCSAGCGRTGAFCVIDSVLNELQLDPENLQRFANGPAPPPLITLYQPSSAERNILAELRTRPVASVNERVQSLMGSHQRHGSNGSSGGHGGGHDTLPGGAGGPQEDAVMQHQKRDVIFETVSIFREQRMSMVQTLRQYVFCYEAILWRLAIDLTKNTPNQVVIPPPETLHDGPNAGGAGQPAQTTGAALSRANAPITTTDSEFSFFG